MFGSIKLIVIIEVFQRKFSWLCSVVLGVHLVKHSLEDALTIFVLLDLKVFQDVLKRSFYISLFVMSLNKTLNLFVEFIYTILIKLLLLIFEPVELIL